MDSLKEQCEKYWATLDDETQTKLASFRVKKKKSNMASGSGTGNTVYGSGLGLAGKFDKEDCRKTVAMYFILNEVPFREVDLMGFIFCAINFVLDLALLLGEHLLEIHINCI